MATLVKKLRNGGKVIFDAGKFDDWCVYIVGATGDKQAPLDVTYFTYLSNVSRNYVDGKVYADFVSIYDVTTRHVDPKALDLIDTIANTYQPEHQSEVEQWFSVIYAGMVAEENKEHAVLKKRIKRLGIYQTLVDKMLPSDAAHFSKGKNWRELDAIMKNKGF